VLLFKVKKRSAQDSCFAWLPALSW